MTEELAPSGTPFGLAMAALHAHAAYALPGAVVLLLTDSAWLSAPLRVAEEAAAVLSALGARHVPLALLVPRGRAERAQDCVAAAANLAAQFKAVVRLLLVFRSCC
jgi:hypothetical protein